MTKKVKVSFTLSEDNIQWLDHKVDIRKYRSRSHGIDSLINDERKREGETFET